MLSGNIAMEVFLQIVLEKVLEKILASNSSTLAHWLIHDSDELTWSLGLACLILALLAPFAYIWILSRREQSRAYTRSSRFVYNTTYGGDRLFTLAALRRN
jgi:hypothetical protein